MPRRHRVHRSARVQRPGLAVLCLLACAFAASAAAATAIDGRLSTANYVFETFPDAQDEQEIRLDSVNRLAFNVRGLGQPAFSLHTLTTLRGDLVGDGEDLALRGYRSVLRFRPSATFRLDLGRQWVHGGVGSGLVDGAGLYLFSDRVGRLTLFGGTRGYLAPGDDHFEGVGSEAFDASGRWGADFRSRPLRGGFALPGTDWTVPVDLTLGLSASRSYRGGEEEGRRLGFTLDYRPRAGTLLAWEVRYDLAQEIIYGEHLRLRQRLDGGSWSVAYKHREAYAPLALRDSWILNHFGDAIWFDDAFDRSTDELRAHVRRPCMLLKGFDVQLELVEIFPEDEAEDRGDGLAIGLHKSWLGFGYRLQRGYGGDRDGFFGRVRHALNDTVALWGSLNQVSFQYGDEDAGDDTVVDDSSLATRLGADLALAGRFDVSAALEYLTNPRADREVRFLGKVTYRFRHGAIEED